MLPWLHAPHQPEQYALLAAWLSFVTAGILLAAIDLSVRRLPTPIIVAASAAVTLSLAVGAVLAKRPDVVVTPLQDYGPYNTASLAFHLEHRGVSVLIPGTRGGRSSPTGCGTHRISPRTAP